MNLRIGLTAPSSGWEQLLRQEGVPFIFIDPGSSFTGEAFSVLAVTRTLDRVGADSVDAYLRSGGAVIGAAEHLRALGDEGPRKEKIDYLLAEAGGSFAASGLLDLGMEGWIPREANHTRTQENTYGLFAGPWRGGFAVVLPFDPARLLSDDRAASRSFPFSAERLPSERVSVVGKGPLLHLLHAALGFLHHARGLPYAHLWYFPDGRKNLFAFRIDTDGAPQRDVDDLYRLAREYATPLTWFLDVGAHDRWLRHFRGMVDQELGIHCYEHVVLADAAVARKNLQRARHAMEREGLNAEGFASPYGIWTEGLAHVIDEMRFLYSSEFSYAYDALPVYPETPAGRHTALQIPIHPVCIGSMRRVGYAPDRMTQYFDAIVQRKQALADPLFFYHHPSHRTLEVVERLFRSMVQGSIEAVTLGAYARWWKERERVEPEIVIGTGEVALTGAPPFPGPVWFRLILPDGRNALVSGAPSIRLADVAWEPRPEIGISGDLRRSREFDPRTLLGDLFSTLSRKYR